MTGARWRQHTPDHDDTRLWRDATYHLQAAAFWRQLATTLRGHPAVVAYNPLNAPHPERAFGFEDPGKRFAEWLPRARDTAPDPHRVNRRVVPPITIADP